MNTFLVLNAHHQGEAKQMKFVFPNMSFLGDQKWQKSDEKGKIGDYFLHSSGNKTLF